MKYFLSASAIFLATVNALPRNAATGYSVFESIAQIPQGYQEVTGDVNGNIKLNIHLEQQNVDAFEQHLYKISDPEHALYGQHMTQSEIRAMMAPPANSAIAVKQWLSSYGVTPETETSDSITVTVPIAKAEGMLKTKYKQYKDTQSAGDRRVMRTTSYSLPENLHDIVSFVAPTIMFGLRNQAEILRDGAQLRHPVPGYKPIVTDLDISCNTTVTPSCLSYLYNFANFTPCDNSVLGIQGFLNQAAQNSDLEKFLGIFAPQHNGSTFDVISVNGGTNIQNSSAANIGNIEEANLDVQYTISISSPIKNTFISTAGSPPWVPEADMDSNSNEPYLEWLEYLLAQEKLPETLTTSYGDSEQTVPKSYAKKVCNMLGQLGARGTSVMFSSGDFGVGAYCLTNDGKNSTRFNPNFPATCPFVTSVGGTQNTAPEIAWNRNNGPSGSGGFSSYFARPQYQKNQVSHYLRNYPDTWKQYESYFDKSGRAYPDVSALADNYTIILDGMDPVLIGGTSAAGPVFSAIVAMLNSDRIEKGKPTLGFLNPWLYSRRVAKAGGLKDITEGRTAGCAAGGNITDAGFAAVPGYDLATGLGSPNFENLRLAFK